MSERPTTRERQITLEIEANGRPIPIETGTSPLQRVKLKVSAPDGSGRQELLLSFDLDITARTGHKPEVPEPE